MKPSKICKSCKFGIDKEELRSIVMGGLLHCSTEKDDVVLDITSKKSKLISFYPKSVTGVVIEPEEVAEGLPTAKIVTTISTLCEIDDIKAVSTFLDKEGLWIILQNHQMGEDKHDFLSLELLLERYGLEIFHVELNDINGGSFVIYVRHEQDIPKNDSVEAMRLTEQLFIKNARQKNTYSNQKVH